MDVTVCKVTPVILHGVVFPDYSRVTDKAYCRVLGGGWLLMSEIPLYTVPLFVCRGMRSCECATSVQGLLEFKDTHHH